MCTLLAWFSHMFIFLYNGSCLCTFIHYTFSNFGREILICAIKCRQPYRVLANFCNAYLGRRVCTPPPQQNQGPWSCLMFTMRTEGEGFARHHHSKVKGYDPGRCSRRAQSKKGLHTTITAKSRAMILVYVHDAHRGRRVCTPPSQQVQGLWSWLISTTRTEG